MRYLLAVLLAVGTGVTAVIPPALAFPSSEYVNQYGNQVAPLQDPGGNGGGSVYVDGVARSSERPATVNPVPTIQPGNGRRRRRAYVSVDASRGQEGSNR